MNNKVPVVTIDGPAASGKSSVSRELAKGRNWPWVSTGVFYRGVGYVAQVNEVDPENIAELVKICRSSEWKVELTREKTLFLYKGEDVTDLIQQESVGNLASQISRHSEVRSSLLQAQRRLVDGVPGLIAEGRDCGTVVFPDAEAKIYLTAHSANRAARRVKEHGGDLDEMQKQQKQRDLQDGSRKTAPMQMAEGALLVDTSELDLSEVIQKVRRYVNEKIPAEKSS